MSRECARMLSDGCARGQAAKCVKKREQADYRSLLSVVSFDTQNWWGSEHDAHYGSNNEQEEG